MITVVDEVGNLKVEHATRTKEWDLPKVETDRRRSMVRRYGSLFKPEQDGLDGKPSPPGKGLTAEGWRRVTVENLSFSFLRRSQRLGKPWASPRHTTPGSPNQFPSKTHRDGSGPHSLANGIGTEQRRFQHTTE